MSAFRNSKRAFRALPLGRRLSVLRERIYELALWAMVIVLVAIGVSLLAFTASQLAQLFWNLL